MVLVILTFNILPADVLRLPGKYDSKSLMYQIIYIMVITLAIKKKTLINVRKGVVTHHFSTGN